MTEIIEILFLGAGKLKPEWFEICIMPEQENKKMNGSCNADSLKSN